MAAAQLPVMPSTEIMFQGEQPEEAKMEASSLMQQFDGFTIAEAPQAFTWAELQTLFDETNV